MLTTYRGLEILTLTLDALQRRKVQGGRVTGDGSHGDRSQVSGPKVVLSQIVILSEVRRQPNAVEGPRDWRQFDQTEGDFWHDRRGNTGFLQGELTRTPDGQENRMHNATT